MAAVPQKDVLVVAGTDTKRAEQVPLFGTTATSDGRHTFFIILQKPGGSPTPFKNENTGWGWPPYFKFNAPEIQATAQAMIGQEVAVTYFGWRNQIFGTFPDIVSLDPAGKNTGTTSWVRGTVFTLWGLLLVFLFSKLKATVRWVSVRVDGVGQGKK